MGTDPGTPPRQPDRLDRLHEPNTEDLSAPSAEAPLSDRERSTVLRSQLFQGLAPEAADALLALGHRGALSQGQALFREREPASHVYVVVTGVLEAKARDPFSGLEHTVGTFRPGDALGELALLDGEPRGATVVASEDASLVAFSIEDLVGLSPEAHPPDVALRLNLARLVSTRFRRMRIDMARTGTDQVEQARLRSALGILLNTVVVLFCVFLLATVAAAQLLDDVADTILLNIPIAVAFAGGLYYAMRKSGLRMDFYGLTLSHWRWDVVQAVTLSIPWLAGIVVAKLWMMDNLAIMADEPLFEFRSLISADPALIVFSMLAYAVFAPTQEFITRCGVQSALEAFLVGPRRELVAMVVATLMFIFTHIHLDPIMPLLVAPLGFFWGWIYMKQKSLVGVSASHVLIGIWALYVVGFGDLVPS